MKNERRDQIPDAMGIIRSYFDKDSIVYGKSGNPVEIKLPNITGDEARNLVLALKEIGVMLTAKRSLDDTISFSLKNPTSIAIMLDRVFRTQDNESGGLKTINLSGEGTTDQLDEIHGQTTTEEDGEYPPDVLEMIERSAIEFYSGDTDPSDESVNESKRYPEKKLIRSKFQWKNGELFDKDGAPVTTTELRQLLQSAKESPKDLATVCEIYEGLVKWVAFSKGYRKYVDHLVSMEDLLQAGREGLIHAIRGHELPENEDKAAIITYLVKNINGYMLRALSRERGGTVTKLPTDGSAKSFRQEAQRQRVENGYLEPDLDTLRENTQLTAERVKSLYQVVQQTAVEYDDGDPSHQEDNYRPDEHIHFEDQDFGDPSEKYPKKDLRRVVSRLLATALTPREERVIRLRYFYNLSADEIRKKFSVPRDRIRQIESKALRKLSHPARSKILKDFIEAAE